MSHQYLLNKRVFVRVNSFVSFQIQQPTNYVNRKLHSKISQQHRLPSLYVLKSLSAYMVGWLYSGVVYPYVNSWNCRSINQNKSSPYTTQKDQFPQICIYIYKRFIDLLMISSAISRWFSVKISAGLKRTAVSPHPPICKPEIIHLFKNVFLTLSNDSLWHMRKWVLYLHQPL